MREHVELPPPLPEQTRLLHIGLMKTGTTAIQQAASARRKTLLRHGVRYPGRRYNHRQAALALMGRRSSTAEADDWTELVREIEADPARRIWISNEFICGCDDAEASRFLHELGPRTHVVITLRGVPAVLPSIWQQDVKTGTRLDFEAWLAIVLADPPDPAALPPLYARHDQGAVVARWAQLAGPENVTVLVADKNRPRQLERAFEALLGLPAETLSPAKQRGGVVNRSLSAEEAALFLRVNQLLAPRQMSRDELTQILRGGAVARVLDTREPGSTDTPIALPDWADHRAAQVGEQYAAVIAGTGVRVVGDLDQLAARPRHRRGRATMPDVVPVDLAAEALLGAMSAGLNRGSDFGKIKPPAVRAPASPVRRRWFRRGSGPSATTPRRC